MPGANPRFETYFAKPKPWLAEFNALRAILLECGLDEELKWRQPCYTLNGANVVLLGGFKAFCALSFFKGALLPDPKKLLVTPGPNSKAAKFLKFTSLEQITAQDKTIRAMIHAAIALEKSGAKVDFSANKQVKEPVELAAQLNTNATFKKAWDGLTPGRRRGWVILIESAKQEKTRLARIAKAKPKILQGLGPHD